METECKWDDKPSEENSPAAISFFQLPKDDTQTHSMY